MTNQHPIAPPPELVQQWDGHGKCRNDAAQILATQAAQWGADQELDACCEWLERNYNYPQVNHPLRAARRPKPPSLKENALESLERIPKLVGFESERAAVRLALEALPND